MTAHKHRALMMEYAYECRYVIQLWSPESGKWENVSNPCFNPDVEYRIKPDQKHPVITEAERELERARWVLYDAQEEFEEAQDEFEEAQDVLARIS